MEPYIITLFDNLLHYHPISYLIASIMASQTVLGLKGPTLGRAAYLRTDPSLRLRFRHVRGKLISNIYCFFLFRTDPDCQDTFGT